ncbi:MAG: LCP family protein [Oscillospiraceae bacterium]|nr:LCP family protein [Oscillospiraceae bacterium]
MSEPSSKGKGPWKRRVLVSISVILALVLLALSGLLIYGSYLLGKIDHRTEHPTLSQEEAESIMQEEQEPLDPESDGTIGDAVVPSNPVEPLEKGKHIVNILLIGQDRRPGEGTQRSDSMILLTFNKSTRKLTLTSIMRDQYVYIPGYGNDKLCHAYQYGGMPLLNRTLLHHFGLRVDGNIEVDFSGFQRIIDYLGGVELELTAREAAHLNKVWGWQLQKGKNLLSGQEALTYARLRSIDSDYARAQRQQKVLMSLFDKYKRQSLTKILSLTEKLLELVVTDIPRNQIMSYVLELAPMFSGAAAESFRIPVDGTFKGGYIKVSDTHKLWCQHHIDFEANRRALERIFRK